MKLKIKSSIALTTSVVLLLLMPSDSTAKALAFPETDAAAPKQHCTITPSGPATFNEGGIYGSPGQIMIAATWSGTLHCDNPTPLEGSTFEVRQRLAVHVQKGRAMGPTQIVLGLIYGADQRSEPFHGDVQGDVTCDAGVCMLKLETRANGSRGSQLRGSVAIEVDAATHEVLSFTPDTVSLFNRENKAG